MSSDSKAERRPNSQQQASRHSSKQRGRAETMQGEDARRGLRNRGYE